MVEPAESPGAIRFAIIVSLMVVSAGVASFPPARDFRVFLGAVIMGGAWIAALWVIKLFDDWAITSSFFILDMLYIAGFYLISRPRKNDGGDAARERNWAGYVVATLTIIVAVDLVHVLSANDFYLKPLAIVLLGAISFLIFFGFARGFSRKVALAYLATLLAINLLAINFYVSTANILTMVAFFIIIWRAARGVKQNVIAWTASFRDRR